MVYETSSHELWDIENEKNVFACDVIFDEYKFKETKIPDNTKHSVKRMKISNTDLDKLLTTEQGDTLSGKV